MDRHKLCVFIGMLFVLFCFVMATWRSSLAVSERFVMTGILAFFAIVPLSWCFEEE